MEGQDRYPQRQPGERRVISFTLGLPTVVGGFVILCGGFFCVFLLGLFLGSGYPLESRFPVLERILPQQAQTPPPQVIAKDEPPPEKDPQPAAQVAATEASGKAGQNANKEKDSGTAPQRSDPSADKNAAPPPQGGIMDRGELAYRESLKPENARLIAGNPSKKRDAKSGQDKTGAAKKAAAQAALKKKPETEPSVSEKQKTNAKGQRFRYTYQAASYKDQASADKYVAGLKKAGFNARTEKSIEKGAAWYRVMLDFIGTPEETDALRSGMQARGVPKILLRSKTPVQ